MHEIEALDAANGGILTHGGRGRRGISARRKHLLSVDGNVGERAPGYGRSRCHPEEQHARDERAGDCGAGDRRERSPQVPDNEPVDVLGEDHVAAATKRPSRIA